MAQIYDLRTESFVAQPSGYFGEARWHPHPPRNVQPSNLQPQTMAGILAYRGKDIASFPLWQLLTDAKNAPDKPVDERNFAYAQLDKLEKIADVMRDIGYRLPGQGKAVSSSSFTKEDEDTIEYSQNHVNRGRNHVTVDLPRATSKRRVPLGPRGGSSEDKDAYGTFVRRARKHEVDGVLAQLKHALRKIRQTVDLSAAHERAIVAFEADDAYDATKGREVADRMVLHENRVASGKNMHGETRYWPSVAADPFLAERDPVRNWGIHIASGVFICCGQPVSSLHPGCFIDTFSATDSQSQPARFAQRAPGDGMTGQQWIDSYKRGTAYLNEALYEKMHNGIKDALSRLSGDRFNAAFAAANVRAAFSALGSVELTKLITLFRRVFAYNAYRRDGVPVPGTSLEWARFIANRVFGLSLPVTLQEPIPPRPHETEFDMRVLTAITGFAVAVPPAAAMGPPPPPAGRGRGIKKKGVKRGGGAGGGGGVGPAPGAGGGGLGLGGGAGTGGLGGAPAPGAGGGAGTGGPAPGAGAVRKVTAAVNVELDQIRKTPAILKDVLTEATKARNDAVDLFNGKTSPSLALTQDGIDNAVKEVDDLYNKSNLLVDNFELDLAIDAIDDAGVVAAFQTADKLVQNANMRLLEVETLVQDEDVYQQFLLGAQKTAADIRRVLGEAAQKAGDAAAADSSKLAEANGIIGDANALQTTLTATENDTLKATGVPRPDQVVFNDEFNAYMTTANQLLTRAVMLGTVAPPVVTTAAPVVKKDATVPTTVPTATATAGPTAPVVKKDATVPTTVPTATATVPAATATAGPTATATSPVAVKKEPATPPMTPVTTEPEVLPRTPKRVFNVERKQMIDDKHVIQPVGIDLLKRAKSILEQLDAVGDIKIPTADGTGTETINLWKEKDFLFRIVNQEAIQPVTFFLIGTPVKAEDSKTAARNYRALYETNKFSLSASQRNYLFEGDDAPAKQILLLRTITLKKQDFNSIVRSWLDIDNPPAFSPEGHAYEAKADDEELTAETIRIFRGKGDNGKFRQRLGLLGRAWANFVAILMEITSEPLASIKTARAFKSAADKTTKIAEAKANIENGVDADAGFIVLQKMDAKTGALDSTYAVPAMNAVEARLIAEEEAFLLGDNIANATFPEQALIEQLASSGVVRPEELAVFARLRSDRKNDIRAIAVRMKDFERNQMYVSNYDKDGVPTKLDLELIRINLLSEFFAYVAQSNLFSRDQRKALRLANQNGQPYKFISADIEGDTVFDVADMTVQQQIDLIHGWARVADVVVMNRDPSVDRARVKEAIDALFSTKTKTITEQLASLLDW